MSGLKLILYLVLCIVVPIVWGVATDWIFNRAHSRLAAGSEESADVEASSPRTTEDDT